MTRATKPVTRETYGTFFDRGNRRVIVTIGAPIKDGPSGFTNLIELRLKGTRRSYAVTVEGLYAWALRMHVERELREKRQARKNAKKRR